MKKGIAYAVGVGPGDPELVTLKAVRIIKGVDVIAVAGDNPKESIAYKIAEKAVDSIGCKKLIGLHIPMINDIEQVRIENTANANVLEEYLDKGQNVAFLTIGDPTIFCSFSYIQEALQKDGYETQLINGVTSFCAAAAVKNTSLVQWEENLSIISSSHNSNDAGSDKSANYVYMKAGKKSGEIRDYIKTDKRDAYAVERCGLEGERLYDTVDDIPDSMNYLSIIICKNK